MLSQTHKTSKFKLIKNVLKPQLEMLLRMSCKNCIEPEYLTNDDFRYIDQNLRSLGTGIEDIELSMSDLVEFANSYDFDVQYGTNYHRFQKKLCEYFTVEKLIDFSNMKSDAVYIDAASMGGYGLAGFPQNMESRLTLSIFTHQNIQMNSF